MSKLSFSVIIKEICKPIGCRTSQLQRSYCITTIHLTSANLKAACSKQWQAAAHL